MAGPGFPVGEARHGLFSEILYVKRTGNLRAYSHCVFVCDCDCVWDQMGTIDFCGTIHIKCRQTSKKTIADANAEDQCEWTLRSTTSENVLTVDHWKLPRAT